MKRPVQCDGCVLNPQTPGFVRGVSGEFVPPHGPEDADLLVIGIAPAEVEEETGIPFTGPAGKKLQTALDWATDGRSLTVRKTNLVNCRTLKRGLSQEVVNRDPTVREARECMTRWLLPELRRTEAKVILVLGQLPFDLILQPLGLKLWNLPRIRHRFVFGLAMGHRTVLPRAVFSKGEDK